jgi:hypothetical protein
MTGHAPEVAPLVQTLGLFLEQLAHLLYAVLYHIPLENVLGGGLVGFLVTYLFIALQRVLKKVLTFCVFATFTFTTLLFFVHPDVIYIDWHLLSIHTQHTLNQVGRTAGNTFERLPTRDLDAWVLLGLVVGGAIAYRIQNPPKHEFKWGGGGSITKKKD